MLSLPCGGRRGSCTARLSHCVAVLSPFFLLLWVRCERAREISHTFTHTPPSVVFGPDFVQTMNNSKVFSHLMPVFKSTCLHLCGEHRIVFDPSTSASAKRSARERQKSPNMLSLSGIISTMCRKILFHLTSLSVSFTDAGEQSKRRLLVSGTQVHRTRCKTHEKSNLSGIEPRFQLFQVTNRLVTEPNLVTVKSVDHRTKTYDVPVVAFFPSLH